MKFALMLLLLLPLLLRLLIPLLPLGILRRKSSCA